MRFFLDNNVDRAVGRMLRRRRHQVWTAAEAGLARARDDDLTVYADTHGVVLLTHDREFTKRRRRHPIGQHVHLACEAWDAMRVLGDSLDALIPILDGRNPVVVRVSPGQPPRILEDDWQEEP